MHLSLTVHAEADSPVLAELPVGELMYQSTLEDLDFISDWRMEGPGEVTFEEGWMRMRSVGQRGHHVFWCPVEFPKSFVATWQAQNQHPRPAFASFSSPPAGWAANRSSIPIRHAVMAPLRTISVGTSAAITSPTMPTIPSSRIEGTPTFAKTPASIWSSRTPKGLQLHRKPSTTLREPALTIGFAFGWTTDRSVTGPMTDWSAGHLTRAVTWDFAKCNGQISDIGV